MDLRQLEAFVAVARLGSFRAAAKHLHITQPAVSSRVSQLEREFGATLFERGNRSVRLTYDGIELVKLAREIVGLSARLRSNARGTAAHSGLVRIGVTNILLPEQVHAIRLLAREYFPGRAIEMHVDTAARMHPLLIERKLDCAITGRINENSFEHTKFTSYESNWFVSPGLETPRRLLTLDDIVEIPVVTYSSESGSYAYIGSALESLGVRHHDIIACDNTASILQMVTAGRGIGAAFGPRVTKAIKAGEVRKILVDVRLPSFELMTYYPIGAAAPTTDFLAKVKESILHFDAASGARSASASPRASKVRNR